MPKKQKENKRKAKKTTIEKSIRQPDSTKSSGSDDDILVPDWAVNQIDTSSADLDDIDVANSPIKLPESITRIERSNQKRKKGRPRKQQAKSNAGKAVDNGAKSSDPKQDDALTKSNGEQVRIPSILGILSLRNVVVFPGTVIPLAVARPRSRRLLAKLASGELNISAGVASSSKGNLANVDHASGAIPHENIMGVITQKNPGSDNPDYNDLYQMGTVVAVLKTLKLPDGQNSVVVHGLIRFRVLEWLGKEPYMKARIEVISPTVKPCKNLEALVTNIRNMAEQMVQLSPNIPDEVTVVLSNIENPGALADYLSANINVDVTVKQSLLEEVDIIKRLEKLSLVLAEQLELLELSAKIQQQVTKSIDKTQREYFLQEQLKAIQSELGQKDQKSAELDGLRNQINEAEMPEKVQAEALRELDRLTKIPIMSPEFGVLRGYIDWLCELPWSKCTRDKLNLADAKRILNRDHYDLVNAKKRILEFLAVRKLNPDGRSPILCFVGPPGVGKTSLGRSIAGAMGRNFVRISLGGIRDEADIRGHRRTYIGALPGRIIQELRKCESNNPVFMLDELDKIGQDFRGDPASALLEVLDPEQNNTFTDHFIDQPFDLSKVLFIGTANYLGGVPIALRDRLEVLELPGYTANEKLAIAKRYLVTRQLKENGLTARMLKVKDETLVKLIESYTREAGVRELERQIAAICRSIAAEIAGNKRKSATVSANSLFKILGPPKYEPELAMRTSTPGVATGLAYTPVGGEILFIESTLMPGKGSLILTGHLGDVMKESAQAAWSVLKSTAVDNKKSKARGNGVMAKIKAKLGNIDEIGSQDLHVHVPAGAVPKDGPSAGLAIYTSIASLLSQQAVRANIAMTGEITLRGQVLPIGGVKEKLLAAKRAGIKTVILPERNRKDLHGLTKEVVKGLKFEFVRRVDQVLRIALEN